MRAHRCRNAAVAAGVTTWLACGLLVHGTATAAAVTTQCPSAGSLSVPGVYHFRPPTPEKGAPKEVDLSCFWVTADPQSVGTDPFAGVIVRVANLGADADKNWSAFSQLAKINVDHKGYSYLHIKQSATLIQSIAIGGVILDSGIHSAGYITGARNGDTLCLAGLGTSATGKDLKPMKRLGVNIARVVRRMCGR